ncbi:MAG: caspase family protein [Candidatus Cloacimonetes bacterium]|nr:caspase family protein [Candidatus Cloacimonadota bacterium]
MKTLRLFILSLIIVISSMTIMNAQVIDLKKGLVAHYPFNGNAYDKSGNGNHGTVHGATLTADRFGNANSAFSFDGKNDYINLVNNSLLNFGSNSFSISVWFKTNKSKMERIISNGHWGWTKGYVLGFNHWSEGTIGFGIGSGLQKTSILCNTISTYKYHKWHHFVVVVDRNKNILSFYVNGIQEGIYSHLGSKTSGKNLYISYPNLIYASSSDPINIGRHYTGKEYFLGKIDDIRFFNRAINSDEVKILFKEGKLTLKEEIEIYVKNKIKDWEKRGEYEKTTDYEKRINETTRKNKILKLKQKTLAQIALQRIDWKKASHKYDPDREVMVITIKDFSPLELNVPIAEARFFNGNFTKHHFSNPKFCFDKEDNLTITYLEITDPYGKKYIYGSGEKEVKVFTGPSDVDLNIPETKIQQTNTYVLIIGNEDYKSRQEGLRIDQNVDFAVNDAQVFSLYCEKTLGVPNKQIKYIQNATSSEIKQSLAWINNLSKIENGKAKLIFYYSGHGLPDQQTEEAYIIPVDVAGTNLKYAIKLADIYKKLTEHPAKQITVFLDACFSGGARNEALIAMKGVKIKPKQNYISENFVVFTSSSGKESSAVYHEKQHGYFTYFLLKKLKDTKGDVNYKDLADYIKTKVEKETGLKGIIQTPQVNTSLEVKDDWKEWKIK